MGKPIARFNNKTGELYWLDLIGDLHQHPDALRDAAALLPFQQEPEEERCRGGEFIVKIFHNSFSPGRKMRAAGSAGR